MRRLRSHRHGSKPLPTSEGNRAAVGKRKAAPPFLLLPSVLYSGMFQRHPTTRGLSLAQMVSICSSVCSGTSCSISCLCTFPTSLSKSTSSLECDARLSSGLCSLNACFTLQQDTNQAALPFRALPMQGPPLLAAVPGPHDWASHLSRLPSHHSQSQQHQVTLTPSHILPILASIGLFMLVLFPEDPFYSSTPSLPIHMTNSWLFSTLNSGITSSNLAQASQQRLAWCLSTRLPQYWLSPCILEYTTLYWNYPLMCL